MKNLAIIISILISTSLFAQKNLDTIQHPINTYCLQLHNHMKPMDVLSFHPVNRWKLTIQTGINQDALEDGDMDVLDAAKYDIRLKYHQSKRTAFTLRTTTNYGDIHRAYFFGVIRKF